MTITIEPIRGIMVGSYGQTVTLTVVDEDGIVQDVSGYTDILIVARSPDGRTTVTATGSYGANLGTDGQINFSFTSSQIDRSGTWNLQVEFSTSSEIFKTRATEMDVGQGLRS